MKLKNKFVYALLIGSLVLTGCSSAANSTTEVQAQSDLTADAASTITGMIESIDVDAATITVSTMGQGGGQGGDGAPAEMPGEQGQATSDGEPPAMPDNAAQSSDDEVPDMPDNTTQSSDDEVPDMPDGQGQAPADGNASVMPDGQGGQPGNGTSTIITITDTTIITDESHQTITLADLSQGSMITVTLDEAGNALTIQVSSAEGQPMGAGGGPGGSSSVPESYTAVNTYTTDAALSGESISSTGTDENAILVQEAATVTLDNMEITRTSSDSTGGDSSSFYGVGAAVLATDGTVNIDNSTITTDAAGGAGVFAYGTGVANVSNTTIVTTQNTSGGIHVAGGGTLHAENLTVETSGESSAAVRSDRGSGVMTISGGTYTSNGSGSPAVYSTADITIDQATLTATGAEAVCIEGLNSLALTDCDLSGNMPEDSQNDCTWTVILYQSMSGDSEVGNSSFTMEGGTLTSYNGGLFYTTNTESTFLLSDVDITYSESNDFFLKCTGNRNQRGWGQSGANGADCSFTAQQQEMTGNILWDSISTLDFHMTEGSVLTGAFVQDESNVTATGDGYASLTIDDSSSWIVTGDSILTSLTCSSTINDVNGYLVTIQTTDGTVLVEGTSPYTITVEDYQA